MARMNSQWISSRAGFPSLTTSACGSRFDMVTNQLPFLHLSDMLWISSIIAIEKQVLLQKIMSASAH